MFYLCIFEEHLLGERLAVVCLFEVTNTWIPVLSEVFWFPSVSEHNARQAILVLSMGNLATFCTWLETFRSNETHAHKYLHLELYKNSLK